jgi:hypothetical protein
MFKIHPNLYSPIFFKGAPAPPSYLAIPVEGRSHFAWHALLHPLVPAPVDCMAKAIEALNPQNQQLLYSTTHIIHVIYIIHIIHIIHIIRIIHIIHVAFAGQRF